MALAPSSAVCGEHWLEAATELGDGFSSKRAPIVLPTYGTIGA